MSLFRLRITKNSQTISRKCVIRIIDEYSTINSGLIDCNISLNSFLFRKTKCIREMKDWYIILTSLRSITFIAPWNAHHVSPILDSGKGPSPRELSVPAEINLKEEREKEITSDPRQRQLPAARCGPHPSSTSSALALPPHAPMITDRT